MIGYSFLKIIFEQVKIKIRIFYSKYDYLNAYRVYNNEEANTNIDN